MGHGKSLKITFTVQDKLDVFCEYEREKGNFRFRFSLCLKTTGQLKVIGKLNKSWKFIEFQKLQKI